MKKIFLLLFVLASSLCMNAQNIKYVELTQDGVFTPSPVSDEWRDVDSIVVTGTLGNKNYFNIFFPLTTYIPFASALMSVPTYLPSRV
jgi:hypothetical protein